MACFRCAKKKKDKHPPVEHIIQQLVDTETLLMKQQEDLEKQIEECVNIAKANAITSPRTAMRALQKKKRLESNLEHVDYTLNTLELQRSALENAKTNAVVLESMKRAGKILKKANIKLDNDRVQNLMDDISEQRLVGGEISTLIRGSLVLDGDEDELAKELRQIQANMVGSTASRAFPSVPTELDMAFLPNDEAKGVINDDPAPPIRKPQDKLPSVS